MAKCKALTKSGEPCKNEALPGQDYCRVHLPKAEEPEDMAIVIKHEDKKVRVRYLGRTSYWVAGYQFTPQCPVHAVPEKLAEHLLETQPELFEIEE